MRAVLHYFQLAELPSSSGGKRHFTTWAVRKRALNTQLGTSAFDNGGRFLPGKAMGTRRSE